MLGMVLGMVLQPNHTVRGVFPGVYKYQCIHGGRHAVKADENTLHHAINVLALDRWARRKSRRRIRWTFRRRTRCRG